MDILATKYRPKRLLDVVGQEVAKKSIYNSIKENRVHHSYLFTGKMGSAKTSLARIFAYLMHSGADPDEVPDLNNKETRAIFNGDSIDVVELDAASSSGVDNMRDLKNQAAYSPVSGRKKIYIIDEAHRLSASAWDVLLKITESPSPHVMFMFATTESEKVPDTIKSRCIKFNLSQLDWREIEKHLYNICKKENINISESALKIISQSSDGSMRLALNNLELVCAYAGKETINDTHALRSLGVADDDSILLILESIFNKKAETAFLTINKLVLASSDTKNIINKIEYHLKNILNCKICENSISQFGLLDDDIKKYNFISSAVKGRSVAKVIGQLVDIKKGLEVNLDMQMLLEQFVVNSIIEIVKDGKVN